jgi:hypothetical protein
VAPTATPTATPTPVAWPAADRIARGFFSHPVIAVDSSGAVHIATRGIGDDNQGIWYLTNATGRWVKRQVATAPYSYEETLDDGPEIAIDPSDGSVWIAFTYGDCPDTLTCTYSEGVFLVSNAGGAWAEPVQLTGENTSDASLVVRDGHVYLAWDQYSDCLYACPSSTWFGADASGEWAVQQIAGIAQSPQLVVSADGEVGILFTQEGNRYARQKVNGSFVVERMSRHGVGRLIAVDAVTGDTWVALSENRNVFLASRGPDGWSDPVMAVPDAYPVWGLGVRDGVVHLIAEQSRSLMYADNASGTFDTVMLAPANSSGYYSALALGPTGRPYVVLTHDVSGPMGIWFLEGPGS